MTLLADSLSLNGGTIASPTGPAAELGHPGATRRRPPPPAEPELTARWVKFPPGHSGDGRTITVRVQFSEPVTILPRDLRSDALSVTGGVIDGVWKIKGSDGQGRDDLWAVRVMPTSMQPVSLSLAARANCDEQGAICTADGKPLSREISLTIAGPEHELSVADAEVQEAPGAALAFVVTLSGTAPYRIKVDYATEDDTATAGQDYTAVSGQLIFERGETLKTILVPVLDDSYNDDGETMRLMLSNPKRAIIVDGEAVGTITNADPMPQAWLARFGRTVADQVIDAAEERMSAPREGGTELTLGGQRMGGQAAAEEDALDAAQAKAGLETLAAWLRGADDEDDAPGFETRPVTEREFLTGSSFALSDGSEEGSFGALWGRAAVSRFEGREGDLTLDGEVTSGLLGADWALGRSSAGLIVSHSRGEGGYRSEAGDGAVESTLTGLYPWGRYEVSESLALWGVVGYGAGSLTLMPEGVAPFETDMELRMAAVGGRSVLTEAPADGGLELAWSIDAMVVQTSSDAVRGRGGSLAASEAEVTRLGLGVEGTWRGIGPFVPSFAIGLRQDGGDAETGLGADVGAGLVWSAPAQGIQAELRARGLLTHDDGDFREQGLAGSFAWDPDPASERGPSLTIRQTVGKAESDGVDALLRPETRQAFETAADADDDIHNRSLEATLGYGFAMFGGRYTGVPELGFGLTNANREYVHRWRLAEERRAGLMFGADLEAVRRDHTAGDTEPEHRLGLGFGWRLESPQAGGLSFEFRVEGSRRIAANDDAHDDRLSARLTARW